MRLCFQGVSLSVRVCLATLVVLVFALEGMGDKAFGRFDTRDADLVDPEERYNTETYNDKLSYRYPLDWLELWDAHTTGFRAHAGSLNVNRFDYTEDVKVSFNGDWQSGPVGLGFSQSRREDVLEVREERTVRINWRVFEILTLAILGDGGVNKEYGDLGGAIGLWLSPSLHGEAYYWSVDHFYDTKKADEGDERDGQPVSVGTRGLWKTAVTALRWQYEHDLPFAWHRESAGYDYAASRRVGTAQLLAGDLASLRWLVQADVETKDESKVWPIAGAEQEKSLKRRAGAYELGAQRRLAPSHDQTAGVVHIERFARYDQLAPVGIADDDRIEPLSPTTSTRSELAWYVTDYRPWGGRHFGQLGLHVNHVLVREGGDRRETEAKFQTAWDYRMHDRVRVLLNTTWDVDQLGRDFPYGKNREFRPWGGGDIQFIAVF
jgi:hypothetical protein